MKVATKKAVEKVKEVKEVVRQEVRQEPEVQPAGLHSLIGQKVLLFCLNYIYAGKLIEISPDGPSGPCAILEDPMIVYETGSFKTSGYQDAQALHTKVWYVQLATVESFGVGK